MADYNEINILNGATLDTTELNYLDNSTVTNGGVVFGDGSNFTQDADSFFWDASNNRLGIGTSTPTSSLHVISSDTTTAAQIFGDSVTTGTGTLFSFDGLTTGTGTLFSFDGLTTGTGLALNSTSTALTTGDLMSLDWTPGSATSATGDLLNINIGSNGTIGNLLNITDKWLYSIQSI